MKPGMRLHLSSEYKMILFSGGPMHLVFPSRRPSTPNSTLGNQPLVQSKIPQMTDDNSDLVWYPHWRLASGLGP
jgi:hypothetical protein